MSCSSRIALNLIRVKRCHGLSDETVESLILISDSGPLDRAAIVQASGINPHTVRRVVGMLCQTGHILAEKAEGDGRARLYRISPHGRRLVKSMLEAPAS